MSEHHARLLALAIADLAIAVVVILVSVILAAAAAWLGRRQAIQAERRRARVARFVTGPRPPANEC
jgi:hypothetical protein